RDELGPNGGRVLDFGCGGGRYALPLAARPGVEVFAYDTSPAAIRELERNYTEVTAAAAVPRRPDMLCGSFAALQRRLITERPFDLVVLLFGVLGHIQHRAQRVATLRGVAERLAPGGRLIVTVPNRARRFFAEQQVASRLVGKGVLEPG